MDMQLGEGRERSVTIATTCELMYVTGFGDVPDWSPNDVALPWET